MSKRKNNRKGKRGQSGKHNKQWYQQRSAERYNQQQRRAERRHNQQQRSAER